LLCAAGYIFLAFLILVAYIAGVYLAVRDWRTTREWTEFFAGIRFDAAADNNAAFEAEYEDKTDGKTISTRRYLCEFTVTAGRFGGHIAIKREYAADVGLQNVDDEYYFAENTMHLRRVEGGEAVTVSFKATEAEFRRIAELNVEVTECNLAFENLDKQIMTHRRGTHTLTATVPADKNAAFFNGNINAAAANIKLKLSTDKYLSARELTLTYNLSADKTRTQTEKISPPPANIPLPAWAA
jgi:hypothetical protein